MICPTCRNMRLAIGVSLCRAVGIGRGADQLICSCVGSSILAIVTPAVEWDHGFTSIGQATARMHQMLYPLPSSSYAVHDTTHGTLTLGQAQNYYVKRGVSYTNISIL